MLFGIYANENSPPVLCGLMGSCREGGAFLNFECFTYCLAIYLRAHPDKGGIREVRTAVFLPAHLRGQEASEIPPMERNGWPYAYKRA